MRMRPRIHTLALLGLSVLFACLPHPAPFTVLSLPSNLSLGAMSVEQYVADAAGQQAFRTIAIGFPFTDASESIALINAGTTASNGTCPAKAVSIGITPATGTEKLLHTKGKSDLDNNNGYALGRIRALDSECGTAKLAMPARAVYYVIARANPNFGTKDTLKYEVRLIDSATVTDVTPTASPTGRFSFRPCGHGGGPMHAKAEARIKDRLDKCNDSILSLSRPIDAGGDAAVWIACSADCCYADPPPVLSSPSGSSALRKGGGAKP